MCQEEDACQGVPQSRRTQSAPAQRKAHTGDGCRGLTKTTFFLDGRALIVCLFSSAASYLLFFTSCCCAPDGCARPCSTRACECEWPSGSPVSRAAGGDETDGTNRERKTSIHDLVKEIWDKNFQRNIRWQRVCYISSHDTFCDATQM